MDKFTSKYANDLHGTLSGYDRLLFAGTLRALSFADGMQYYLNSSHIKLVDFKTFCARTSIRVRQASEEAVRSAGKQLIYLNSSQESKEERARTLAQEEGVTEGPICMLACIEPCKSFSLRSNPDTKKLELKFEQIQVHAPVSVCYPPDFWFHVCTAANVVSFWRTGLHQWT